MHSLFPSRSLFLSVLPTQTQMEILLITTILISTTLLFLYGLKASQNRRKLPPGREGFPLIGETMRLFAAYRSEDPEPFLDERLGKYGRVFKTHVFGERTVFSVDPEFNRTLFAAEGKTVEGSYPSSIATLLGNHALLITKGARHKRLHSLTLNRLASPAAIRDSPLMMQIDRLVKTTLESWTSEGDHGSVLLMDQTKKITFELTVKQLISFDPGEWTEALRREYVRVVDGFFAVPLPQFLPFFSFTTYGKALKARAKVADALKEVIRARKAERLKGSDDDGNKLTEDGSSSSCSSSSSKNKKKLDMLDELLDLEQEEGEDEMVDFMISILVAGYETTSTIMTLAVKYLTGKPQALQLLREEHERIRAQKRDDHDALDWTDYKSMRFTQCVINETLRVANIIGGVFRRALTDIDFNEYTIPKGCKIIVSLRGVHLDPQYYADARTFNPWRWQKNDALQQANSACIFTPFGGGPRLCPGYELARVIIATFLHYVVTLYSWEEAEKDHVVFLPTTRAVKGYPINVKRREQVGGS